uniref:type II toxin-antitoxin system Phd/YefM family antitoxin n=1 Tax=Streptomyces sp. ND04-05B TaxID=3028693 RepID=UPI0039F5BD52
MRRARRDLGFDHRSIVATCVHMRPQEVSGGYDVAMPEETSTEMGIRELRSSLSEVMNATAVRGQITYVTSHGRRVAAIVPVPDGEAIEAQRKSEGTPPA